VRFNGAEALEAAIEVFDEMTGLVDLLVEGARVPAVALWRDDACLSGGLERLDDTLVGIEGFVGEQDIGLHLGQQGVLTL
jgi:hypothetical protein